MVDYLALGKIASKKGVFFTSVAILLLSTLLLSFSFNSEYRLKTKSMVIETRINTMDDFIKDLDKDMKRSIFISSYRSILTISQKIAADGQFIQNLDETFNELILNGTLNGTRQDMIENTTFTNWTNKMMLESSAIDIRVSFNVKQVRLAMQDPWNIGVTMEVNTYVSDILGTASWNMTKNVTSAISIIGFEDPIYTINTQGKIINTINRTTITDFVSGTDATNLQVHNNKSLYLTWKGAPDFLMRLSGNLNASDEGIESLINLDELAAQGFTIQNRSVVDYIYWSNASVNSYAVNNTPSWFRMDDEYSTAEGRSHISLYEVSGLI